MVEQVVQRDQRVLGIVGGTCVSKTLTWPPVAVFFVVVGTEPINLDFPDDSLVSAWRLRIFPGKPGVSRDSLPK